MSVAPDKPLTPVHAWQPLTPRGVAAFAYASGTRLCVVQLVAAVLVAAAALWLFTERFLPVFREAIVALPRHTVIRNGVLTSSATGPQSLAGNPSIEILLDPKHTSRAGGGAAEITLVLSESNVLACSFLGCATLPYRPGYVISLSEPELTAWWGAWRKFLAAGFISAVVVGLILSWWVAAALFAPGIRAAGFFGDRLLSLAGSWRMAGAALLPGCLVICLGLAFYGFGAVDLLRLGLFIVVYILCSLFFMAASPLFLTRLSALRGNPFSTDVSEPGAAKKTDEQNPFNKR